MTKFFSIAVSFTLTIFFAGCAATIGESQKHVTYVQTGKVVTAHGEYMQQIGNCRVKLESTSMGGYSVLSVNHTGIKEIDDVTGIAWVSPTLLVYTVSPIYGKSGVYLYDCMERKCKRIVAPKNINPAYPDGADYFELYRMYDSKIVFYYAADVDLVDFKEFRTQSFLFRVNLDGSDFVKVNNSD